MSCIQKDQENHAF